MSGGGTQSTVSQQTVPSWLMPYMTGELSSGQALAQSPGPQYYPGQQVAPINSMQEQGLDSLTSAATGPNATQGAQSANQFETSGALLDPTSNPYLQNTFNLANQQVQNGLSSEFAGAGRNIIGSLPIQADESNNLATQLYGGAYQQGLNTMTQASALAPSIDQGMYLPSQELLQGGSGLQSQTQNDINADMNQWNFNQTEPYNQLSWYSSLLGQGASPFSSSSSTSSMPNNSTMTGLGGAASGAALGSSLGPWGTAAGAAIGGLMGLFH